MQQSLFLEEKSSSVMVCCKKKNAINLVHLFSHSGEKRDVIVQLSSVFVYSDVNAGR